MLQCSTLVQAEPSRAVVSVPLRGETTIACRTLGAPAEIEWTRDGAVFSGSETYRQTGREVHLVNVTIQDAGYYYCTARGPVGQTKTASIQVKVSSSTLSPQITTRHCALRHFFSS